MAHLVKLTVVPWDDPVFHAAIDRAERAVTRQGIPIDSPVFAERLQAALHVAGYSAATVDCVRSVDDVLTGGAHWTICRDGAA